MATVRIFGAPCERAGDAVQPPAVAGVTVREWEARFRSSDVLDLRAWLDVAGRHQVSCDLALRTVADASGDLVLAEGRHEQGPRAALRIVEGDAGIRPEGPAFAVVTGAIVRRSATFPRDGVTVAGGTARFAARSVALHGLRDLPLALGLRDARLSVDLSRRTLEFPPGSFRLTTMAALEDEEFVAEFFRLDHASGPVVIPLDAAPGPLVLRLAPADPAGELVLHPFVPDRGRPATADNPIVAPVTVSGHALEVRLDGDQEARRISGLRVVEGDVGRPRLRLWNAAGPRNGPVDLVLEDDLELHVRAGTRGRPAGLVVAPRAGPSRPRLRFVDPRAPFHGTSGAARFRAGGSARLVCDERLEATAPPPPGLDGSCHSEATVPWIECGAEPVAVQHLEHPKPGEAYLRQPDETAVETLRFSGGRLALPLLPAIALVTEDEAGMERRVAGAMDALLAENTYDLPETTHESGLVEGPAEATEALRIDGLFRLAKEVARAPTISIAPYDVVAKYGPVSIRIRIESGRVPDYVLLYDGDARNRFLDPFVPWNLDEESDALRVGGPPDPSPVPAESSGARPRPRALLKLSRRFTLGEIFAREGLDDRVEGFSERITFVENVLEPPLRERSWLGLVMFSVPLDVSRQPVLDDFVGGGTIPLAYVAISPAKNGGEAFSSSARVLWRNPEPSPGGRPRDRRKETRLGLTELDIRWGDNALIHFHAAASLEFHGFFGADLSASRTLSIEGLLDEDSGRIEFVGRLPEPLELPLGAGNYGPLQAVFIESAAILEVAGRAVVALQGEIGWRSLEFDGIDWLQVEAGLGVAFSRLTIGFDAAGRSGGSSWSELSLDYPSLEIPVDVPVFDLGFLSLSLTGIGVSFGNAPFPFDHYLPLYNGGLDLEGEVFGHVGLHLEVAGLPELAAMAASSLSFDFVVALGLDAGGRWSEDRTKVLLRAAGAEGLRLDLLRFLVIEASRVALEIGGSEEEPIRWIVAENVAVRVLGYELIRDLSIYVFSTPDGRRGFLGYLVDGREVRLPSRRKSRPGRAPSATGPAGSATQLAGAAGGGKKKRKPKSSRGVTIHWALVAQNVHMPPGLAEQLLSLDAEAEAIGGAIGDAIASEEVLPQAAEDAVGDWIFAASIDLFGFLQGKFLFQDRAFYGLALSGEVLRKWFRLDLGISVLYVKGARSEEDRFIVSVSVPGVTVPAFRFLGGTISLEVGLNGSLALDVGFPHLLPEGGRDWNRAFGAIITPFQGAAGFYFRNEITSTGGGNAVVVSAGYAAQIGLAAAAGGGTFEVSASVSIYYVLEGRVVLYGDELAGLRFVGALGVIVQARASLNWWIISASLELVIGAEARATLEWGIQRDDVPLLPPFDPGGGALVTAEQQAILAKRDQGLNLQVDLTVWAEASMEACIGFGPFKICGSISVSVPLRFSYELTLG